MTEAEELGTELADFRQRVEELHLARGLPRAEQIPALDAALIELQHVVEALWPRYERLVSAQQNSGGRRHDGQEQQLLRALFQRLPVPTMLLDRDTVVRRLNMAATQLFGMRAGYATGRSLATSLTRDARAAFRSQVAAVARGEGERSLVVHLLRPAEQSPLMDGGALRVTLTALRPPQEPRAAVLAVFQSASTAPPSASAPLPEESVAAPDPIEVGRRTEVLDLVDAMAATLLAVDRGASPDAVAERAAELLHQRFADWVLVDLPGDASSGTLRRACVTGADGELRKVLASQQPLDSPLVVDALQHGAEALQVRPEESAALGRDPMGVPLLARAEVSSLLCVPLVVDGGVDGSGRGEGRTVGVLTLLRTGARRAFELSEASAADRLARLLAIALSQR